MTAPERLNLARHVFFVAAPVGAIVGAAIAAYDYLVNALLWEHLSHSLPLHFLILMPALGMALTGVLLSLFRVPSSAMADEVVRAYHRPDNSIEYRTALPKLAASVATMGFGASAGMEGASKWLGATIASYAQQWLNARPALLWLHGSVQTTLITGAAAGIAAIFRAPLTGAIMGIESPYRRDLAHEALVHGLVASATSYAVFVSLRPATPYFPITFAYRLQGSDLLWCIPLGLAGGLLSRLFLTLLHTIKFRWTTWGANRILKLSAGGLLVSLIAWAVHLLVGAPVTLQAGLPYANALLRGEFPLGLCLIILLGKLLATAFTFGTGGVGGLFVPSATIGAALGAAFDAVLSPGQPGVFTLLGIAAFTAASYNSLLFSAVFIAEATGSPALVVPSLIASSLAFLVSAGLSNSPSQAHTRH
jgi:CIC family chloride channel protein